MKSWKWLVITLTIALLVVYYILGMDLLKQRRQNADLASQVEEMTAALSMLPDNTADLEQQLADARADLAAAESSFSGDTNDTRIINDILRLAQKTGVKAIPLSTRPWLIESIGTRDFAVFHLTLSVAGDLNHLEDFMSQLENGAPVAMVIRYLKVERAPADSGAAIQVNIDIAIYALAAAVN